MPASRLWADLPVLSVELPGWENSGQRVLLFPHSWSFLDFPVNFWGLKCEALCYLLSGATSVFSSKLFRILWKLENRHIQLYTESERDIESERNLNNSIFELVFFYFDWDISQKFGFSIENSRQKTLCGISINNINQTGANCDNQGSSSFRF